MPTPHSFASSIVASGTRLRAAATHRRVKPANKLASWTARSSRPAAVWTTTSAIDERRLQASGDAHAVRIAFEYSRRLTGHLRPPRGIDHGHADRQVQQAVQQGRIDDRAHPGRLTPTMLGDVDDRVGRDPDPEQHDAPPVPLRKEVKGAAELAAAGDACCTHLDS